jgi:hypothetical protein
VIVNVTEAAEAWKTYKRKLKALGPEPKAAEKVLKAWFRAHPKTPAYKGVGYSSAPTSRLDLDKVRAELDPKVLAKCEVPGTRETLSLLEPVAPAKPKAKGAGT